jgi:hypothetical protein
VKVENLSLRWDKIVRYKFKLKREFMKFMNKFKYQNEINKLSKIRLWHFCITLIVKHEVSKRIG